jgi:hypothetical protein
MIVPSEIIEYVGVSGNHNNGSRLLYGIRVLKSGALPPDWDFDT